MRTVHPADYARLSAMVPENACGAVYARSVLEGRQSGIVLTDAEQRSLLVWHRCGFALLFGDSDRAVLREIGDMIQHPAPYKRLFLFAPDDEAAAYFRGNAAFSVGQRLFFRFPETAPDPPADPAAQEITPEILAQISGGNTPAISWDSPAAFLETGGGFCVMRDGVPASWAYASAVSERETDIGVETDPRYRRQGLAFAAASAMIRSVRQAGKKPVWACRAENLGSAKLAAALGFEECGQCVTVMRS